MRLIGVAAFAAISLTGFACEARSEENFSVLLRAVGFALTGTDDVEPKIIDKTRCVFSINNETYFLNNIDYSRLNLQFWTKNTINGPFKFATIDLHGDNFVYQTRTVPLVDDGSETMRTVRKMNPELFKSQLEKKREKHIELDTGEYDRIMHAWAYIYSNGCVAAKSAF